MTCAQCGTETGRSGPEKGCLNVFCGRSCAAKYNSARYPRKPPPKCRKCGIALPRGSTSRMSCEKCKRPTYATTERTIGDVRRALGNKGKHRSWLHAAVREHNRTYNAVLRTRCQVCGYDRHVELAHVQAINTFPDEALLIEVNSPLNNLVFCRNHHWEFDNGVLRLEDVPPRDAG